MFSEERELPWNPLLKRQLVFKDTELDLIILIKRTFSIHIMTFTICIILTPVSVGVAVLPQGNLDVLHLLGDGREHSLFQTVELVEAAPCSHLAQTHKDTTHGLKEKRFINLNDQYEKQKNSLKKANDKDKNKESEGSYVPGNRTSRHS